jgi:hypothetical protein
MPQQFQNPQASKLETEIKSDETAKKRTDAVADELAKKPANTEKKFDKEHEGLFTK